MMLVARRFLAACIDVIILFVPSAVGAFVYSLTAEWTGWHIAATLLTWMLYFSLLERWWEGMTPGKRIARIRVTSTDQRTVTFAQTFSRAALFVIVPLGVGILSDFYGEASLSEIERVNPFVVGLLFLPISICIGGRRGLHDVFAGTAVVTARDTSVPSGVEGARLFGATALSVICIGFVASYYFYRFAEPPTQPPRTDAMTAPFRDLRRFAGARLSDHYRNIRTFYVGEWDYEVEPLNESYPWQDSFLSRELNVSQIKKPERLVTYKLRTNGTGVLASAFHVDVAKTLARHAWRVLNAHGETPVEVVFVWEKRVWPVLVKVNNSVIVIPVSGGPEITFGGETLRTLEEPVVLTQGTSFDIATFFEWPPGRAPSWPGR